MGCNGIAARAPFFAMAIALGAKACSIVSSNLPAGPFNGVNINTLVGANRFYNAGYTGTRSVMANIEAGHVWNGHETLGHVSQLFHSPAFGGTQLGQFDRHATWVGQTMGGRHGQNNPYQVGIARGASLWSGAVATQWVGSPYTTGFTWSNNNALVYPYVQAMLTGVSGRRADVVNSSWNGGGSLGGASSTARFTDGLIRQSARTLVIAAGNTGPGTNSVGATAAGHNGIVVGSLGADTDPNPYNVVSNFSSRSPQDYEGPDGFFAGVRARVDVTAPGQNMTLAFYGGLSGGNVGGSDPSGGANNWYSFNCAGTSFASPIVAGGIGLLTDVGYDRYGGGNSIDARVMKAVILNSADKPTNWTNVTSKQLAKGLTTQALDYTYGAGKLNLSKAFDQYTAGNTDLPGLGGGMIVNTGWDFGRVNQSGVTDYVTSIALASGTTFTATLNWFVNRAYFGTDPNGFMSMADQSFSNLDLELWTYAGGSAQRMVAASRARFISTQHLTLALPQTSQYMVRVKWSGERYDFVGNNFEEYGLAWQGQLGESVPEPGTLIALGTLTLGFVHRSRRNRTTD